MAVSTPWWFGPAWSFGDKLHPRPDSGRFWLPQKAGNLFLSEISTLGGAIWHLKSPDSETTEDIFFATVWIPYWGELNKAAVFNFTPILLLIHLFKLGLWLYLKHTDSDSLIPCTSLELQWALQLTLGLSGMSPESAARGHAWSPCRARGCQG